MRSVNIAILGCGNVGKYVVKNLFELRNFIKEKFSLDINVKKILVRDKQKERIAEGFKIPQHLLTTHFSEIIDSSPDIVVELIGDLENSRTYIRECLNRGIKVVTANKLVLTFDDEIFQNPNVFFDASVGGGIPIIRTIINSVPDDIYEITGILNGTTNFILSYMEEGKDFQESLELAKKLGYAEPDPSFDINGTDAAQKICILSALVFGVRVRPNEILKEGISFITKLDIDFAREFGYSIRSIAISRKKNYEGEEKLEVAVYPALVPSDSPLAQVKGNLNAAVIKGKRIGELFLKGEGAGGNPTSISIIADIIEASLTYRESKKEFLAPNDKLIHHDMMVSKFYVRLSVVDNPGVLAKIADSFGKNNVSIESVLQKGRGITISEPVPIFIITHECLERDIKRALEECSRLDVVLQTPFYLRIYQ
ncbi:Homoserine dehydrogenase [bacterium HR19]|nr:Homoserine dehydrogenase [bacterium HR19]